MFFIPLIITLLATIMAQAQPLPSPGVDDPTPGFTTANFGKYPPPSPRSQPLTDSQVHREDFWDKDQGRRHQRRDYKDHRPGRYHWKVQKWEIKVRT
jgi:hypothetical protein